MPSKRKTAKLKPVRPLVTSKVFVRIRPLTSKGDCAHTDGDPVQKRLRGWSENAVQMDDLDRRELQTYNVTKVIPPEAEQNEACDTILPELLQNFFLDANVMFFAYGQTGSGKTHTMLGEIESLSSEEPVEGWGIYPRVVHATLMAMESWRQKGTVSTLMASAVEFYCMGATDLNGDARYTPVEIDKQAKVFGCKSEELTSCAQLKDFVARMYANRTTAKTKMNDASSRSHCAFILTLHQLRADNTYIQTFFSIIDMAGSERHNKTGGQRLSGLDAGIEAYKWMTEGTPEKLSVGAQGTMINMELSMIVTEVLKASDMHKKGIPFSAMKELSTAASFYFSACYDGRALLGACVTITQSPQHGFETWFGLRFAQTLAKCATPLLRKKPILMKKALQLAKNKADAAAAAFAKCSNKKLVGAKAYRVYALRAGACSHTEETLAIMQNLVAQQDGGGGACGA